jgi:site-specific recombinase XerD
MTLTPLRRRMLEDLQLRGLAPKTQPWYLDAVRHLAHHYHRPPDQLSDEELRQYFLSLRQEKKVAESTFRIHLYGIRFFDELTLTRPWPVFDLVRPRNIQQLPIVLSPREVRALLAVGRNPTAQMCLRLIYACGLRLREGTQLQVADIEPQRRLVRVRQGNGGKERFVPLAPRVLAWWRGYWPHQRPRPWVFPARHQSGPRPPTSRQKTCKAVVRQRGIATDASIHPLRHASATHLLARGVSLRVMQDLLGHQSPRTTARYTPLTPPTLDVVHATINALMADLCAFWRVSMPELADVLRRYGPESLDRFGQDLLPSHRRAIDDLMHCRTEALGGQLLQCDHGGQEHYVDHSCRHRRGPTCHHQDTEAWLAERRQELLPGPYLHLVFTVPHARGEIIRPRQQDFYDILLRAAAQALITLAMDPHDVGGLIGVLCVLHTWTRTLADHPHVHCVVPAGGVSADQHEWRPARTSYLVPVQARSQISRGRCRHLVHQEGPDLTLPEAVWTKGWVVYGKPTVHGPEHVLRYLGRSVHRIALTNNRILSIEDGQVCCRDQDAQTSRWHTMTLPAQEFIRRFLPHV